MENSWYVYVILTDRATLYTGITTDLQRRFQEHCDVFERLPGAKGAKYFRSARPMEIIYHQCFDTRASASQREYEIKKMSRANKLALAER